VALSKQTLQKIDEDPEEFARQFLESVGTDRMEDWMDEVYRVWSDEGSHK
jgi:hypothetical protein